MRYCLKNVMGFKMHKQCAVAFSDWKFDQQGENICAAAVREVKEETGVSTVLQLKSTNDAIGIGFVIIED